MNETMPLAADARLGILCLRLSPRLPSFPTALDHPVLQLGGFFNAWEAHSMLPSLVSKSKEHS